MKFLGLSKYFLLLMLSFGIVEGSNALSSISQSHVSSTNTNLKENHKKTPDFIVNEFVEEIDNDENLDEAHADFGFIAQTIDLFNFINSRKSLSPTPNFNLITIAPNQKINVLNCTFLI